MAKFLLLLLLFLFPLFAFCQSDTFTDPRDGAVYNIVTINGKKWLAQSLKLKTPNSFYPKYTYKPHPIANYYYAAEAQNICPKGWRVANAKDWEHFFAFLLAEAQQTDPSIRVDTFWRHRKRHHGVQYDLSNADYSFFEKHDTLKILNTHLIEGKRKIKMGHTFWTVIEDEPDIKTHVHFGRYAMGIHTHHHHISSWWTKKRMFAVKCVCETP